jgi:hypothetical protein
MEREILRVIKIQMDSLLLSGTFQVEATVSLEFLQELELDHRQELAT